MNIFDPVLEFSRLMHIEYRPQIESLMIDGNSSNELGPNPETLEPLLRAAFEAGLGFGGAQPDQLTPPRVDKPTHEQIAEALDWAKNGTWDHGKINNGYIDILAAEVTRLREIVEADTASVEAFARQNPCWTALNGRKQDPYGAHAALKLREGK